MAVESKGVFTDRDDMLMEPLIELTDNIYCALAAQLKELYTTLYFIYGNIISLP